MGFSIITATYNCKIFISSACESLYSQTFQNIEHIVIDGASTDGTVEFLKQNARISQFISEKDSGIYDALNKGIRKANQNIIGFLHSDDMLANCNILKNIDNAFNSIDAETGRRPDVVYGDLIFVDQEDTKNVIRSWKSRAFEHKLLFRGWMPPHPTVFMRSEVYEKHGLFNTDFKCAADYDYILRVFQDQTLNIIYLPEVIVKMRLGGISTGGYKNLLNKSREDYLILKKNHMPFPLWILFLKNVSKIPQLVFKRQILNN